MAQTLVGVGDALEVKKQQLGMENRGPFENVKPKISTKYEPMAVPD